MATMSAALGRSAACRPSLRASAPRRAAARAVAERRARSSSAPQTSSRAAAVPMITADAAAAAFTLAALDLLATPGVAEAAGREDYGIFAGRTVALIHPAGLALCFGATLWAGYTGWQWRTLRTVGDDIKALKAEAKALKAELPADEESAAYASKQKEIDELTVKRKELAGGNYRDRHFNVGSILLGGGIVLGVEGALNTYMRVGKLFPGPHLFAGAGIVALWALAAALVPAMQKGNDSARNAHIALNGANVALFAWQLPTGWEIVLKVFQFTEWP